MLPHAAIDGILGAAPPFVTAAGVAVGVGLWQALGACLLARFYDRTARRKLGPAWALLLGWATWLPVSGALSLLLALAGLGRPWVYRGLAAVLALKAIPAFMEYARLAWRQLERPRALVWVWALAGLVKATELAYAAHPQRQYDQLNYHLLVAKLLLDGGAIPVGHFDTPLFIAGPVEYAFAWVRALVPSDLFELGAGQFWVYFAAIPAAIMAIVLGARNAAKETRAQLALVALLVLPAVLPNEEFVRLAKPNASLLAGSFVILAAMTARREIFVAVATGLGLMMIAVNQTFLHAALALVVVAVAVPSLRRRLRVSALARAPGLVVLGVLCLTVAVVKSQVLTGTPFYPSSARFIASPLANEWTLMFWGSVAAAGETTKWSRFLGGLALIWRSPALAGWLALSLGGAAWCGRRRLRRLWPLTVFVAAYALTWPLFYGYQIGGRFVAAYFGGVVMLGCGALLVAPPRLRRLLVFVAVLASATCFGLDVMMRKLFLWNRGTLNAAVELQFPRFATARWLDRKVKPEATIIVDDPAKFFFDMRVFHSTLSPREQELWARLQTTPQEAAAETGLTALVARRAHLAESDTPGSMEGPILAVWRKLEPFGRIAYIGPDAVLYSNCGFQRFPCGGDDPVWTVD